MQIDIQESSGVLKWESTIYWCKISSCIVRQGLFGHLHNPSTQNWWAMRGLHGSCILATYIQEDEDQLWRPGDFVWMLLMFRMIKVCTSDPGWAECGGHVPGELLFPVNTWETGPGCSEDGASAEYEDFVLANIRIFDKFEWGRPTKVEFHREIRNDASSKWYLMIMMLLA